MPPAKSTDKSVVREQSCGFEAPKTLILQTSLTLSARPKAKISHPILNCRSLLENYQYGCLHVSLSMERLYLAARTNNNLQVYCSGF